LFTNNTIYMALESDAAMQQTQGACRKHSWLPVGVALGLCLLLLQGARKLAVYTQDRQTHNPTKTV